MNYYYSPLLNFKKVHVYVTESIKINDLEQFAEERTVYRGICKSKNFI